MKKRRSFIRIMLKSLYLWTILGLLHFSLLAQNYIPKDKFFDDNARWMRKHVEGLVKTNRGELSDGTTVFYADGSKHYNLIFTRGFAYMYEFTGDLIDPKDAKEFLEFQLGGIRSDGCVPDRVDSQGDAIYSPGPKHKPMADYALDNAPFIAATVCRYVKNSRDIEFFKKYESILRKAMDFIPRSKNGLVYNDPNNAQCVYGFTDVVKKTGNLLFSSVLYYKACLLLEEACKQADVGEPEVYAKRAELIKKNIGSLWDRHSGAFYAASGECKQYDVWGTAFLLAHPGLASEEQEKAALDFLVDNYDRYVEKGQIRHLLFPETWQSTFEYRASGVYQNGAYWATPLAWYIPVIAKKDPELAAQTLQNCLNDFKERGIYEWVNGGVKVLHNYFVSAASVYSLIK